MTQYNLGEGVKIANSVRINVSEYLEIGSRSVINENVIIEGRHIKIGKEAWLDEYAHIGGGSCFDYQSYLEVGDFLHMGRFSHINIARRVTIGDECGVGIGTKIFTHGAYLSAFDGFPVKFADVSIGDRVWLPNAWVNPGVKIGNDVVVAALSLVNRDLPDGCLAGGIPVKIIEENRYPRELLPEEQEELIKSISQDVQCELSINNGVIFMGETTFSLRNRVISGRGNELTEKVRNQLRRYGIRFRYSLKEGEYKPWQ